MITGTTEATGGSHGGGTTADPLAGLVVADTYRVGRHLGSGGMGEVREAEHVRLGRPVAIKFLRADALAEAGSVERFQREARRAATIRSEHVVKVFDYGQLADGTPYLVMERLVGEDLSRLFAREGALPVRRAVKLAVEACRGLAAVHAAGLVHRDLKPANLFVERVDGNERCVILDFGVAKAVASNTTRPGALIGTLRYTAPEQLEDSASVTASADIYALGAILFEALTGVPAHSGDTLEEMMFDIIHRPARDPATLRPLPAELTRAILRMLERAPKRRFSQAAEAARALAPFGARGEQRTNGNPHAEATLRDPDDCARGAKRRGRRGATAALCAVFGLGIAGGWVLHGRSAKPSVPSVLLRTAEARVLHDASSRVHAFEPASPPTFAPTRTSAVPPPLTTARVDGAREPATKPYRTSPSSPVPLPLPSGFDPKDPYE